MKNDIVVLIGAANSGKGTLCKRLCDGYDFKRLGISDILRKYNVPIPENGLVKDEVVIPLMKNETDRLINEGYKILLDGFPRTVAQANYLFEKHFPILKFIETYTSLEERIKRAANRRVCEKCGETYTEDDFKPPKQKGICDKCGGKLIMRQDDKEENVIARDRDYMKTRNEIVEVFTLNDIKGLTIDTTKPYDIASVYEFLMS